MTHRLKLPNRRGTETTELLLNNVMASVSIGRFENGEPAEVFVHCDKIGSSTQTLLRDGAILLSIAIQYGVPLDVIRHALSKEQDGRPQSFLGDPAITSQLPRRLDADFVVVAVEVRDPFFDLLCGRLGLQLLVKSDEESEGRFGLGAQRPIGAVGGRPDEPEMDLAHHERGAVVPDHLLDRVADDAEELVLRVVEPGDDARVVDQAEGIGLPPVDRDLLPVHRHGAVGIRDQTAPRQVGRESARR